MNVDESLYATFNPKLLRRMTKDVKQLVAPRPKRQRTWTLPPFFYGLDSSTVLKFMGTLAAVAAAYLLLISPQRDSLKAAANAICGALPEHVCELPRACASACTRRRAFVRVQDIREQQRPILD